MGKSENYKSNVIFYLTYMKADWNYHARICRVNSWQPRSSNDLNARDVNQYPISLTQADNSGGRRCYHRNLQEQETCVMEDFASLGGEHR
jgi:hypothetical protein